MIHLDFDQRHIKTRIEDLFGEDEITDELFACIAVFATASDRLQTEGGCIICYGYDQHDEECALKILKELVL